MKHPLARDGARDFDFYYGAWHVSHRRLSEPLARSNAWYAFETTAVVRPLWGGKGNIDEFHGESPEGPFEGMTLRLYDRDSCLWSLYWATPQRGLITVPNVGAFDDSGVGDFFSNEEFNGIPIVCRYRWTKEWNDGCRWEQAFSTDRGATWETNWIMEFTRR
jgi:hypothetical protein